MILLTISDVFVRKLAQKHHVIESNGFVGGKTKSQNSDVKIGCVGFVGDKVIVLVCEPAYKLPTSGLLIIFEGLRGETMVMVSK